MTVETATFISDLNATYPASTDAKAEGDNHLRLLKSTIKATFPNINAAVTPTAAELNKLAGLGALSGANTGDQTSVSGSSGSCTGNAATATRLASTTTWNFVETGGVLYFQVSGVSKAKLDASGNLTVIGNVTAYGTM